MPERSQELKDFIDRNGSMFWYSSSPKSEKVSDNLLVETLLNYGTMEQIKELFDIMGIKTVAKIFFDCINRSERSKGNYYPEIRNYFQLYFNKYAS
ncbi:MAG: hypothetical protein LBE91_18740 [Tannerella sp.]|jgi:hypothetical protein|nr:hypothetical protein [Tannerella sp.]